MKSVQLIGSWDNFSTWYTMRQDVRRGRGQWRGCYSFKDIISREEPSTRKPTRNGGLNMGDTYYYYVSHFFLPHCAPKTRFLHHCLPAVRSRRLYRNTRSFATCNNSLSLYARPDCQHSPRTCRADPEAPQRFGQFTPARIIHDNGPRSSIHYPSSSTCTCSQYCDSSPRLGFIFVAESLFQ